jgi:hypothetical protein
MPAPAIRLDRRGLASLFVGLAVAGAARAATPEIRTTDGLALGGYDPVAYFALGAPRRGDAAIEAEWRGARWRFVSAAHREMFLADPDRYAPRYGANCAWAMAQGYLAPADPLQWRIVDGRLYVNYDAAVHRRWLRDVPGMISAADRNWPRLLAG